MKSLCLFRPLPRAAARGSPLAVPQPHLQCPCPCQGTLSKASSEGLGSPHCWQGQSSHRPQGVNEMFFTLALCSVKHGLGELWHLHTGPSLPQFSSSISPPCRAVPALLLFMVRKKGNNSISYSDITFSAPLKACMCLNRLCKGCILNYV